MQKPFASETSSLASSVATPPNSHFVMPKRVVRGVRSSPQLNPHRVRTSIVNLPETVQEVETPAECDKEPSFGELDAYPLRRSSAVCKATGGGRWCPKQSPPQPGLRVPGGKAPFEIEMEREEEEARLRHLNPIVRDGGKSSIPPHTLNDYLPILLQSSDIDLSGNPSNDPSLPAALSAHPSICRLSNWKLPYLSNATISA
jgi:hypothetical protein